MGTFLPAGYFYENFFAMLRFLFAFVVFLHGMIHLMGFVKAFKFAPVNQLTQSISKVNGALWLVSAILFIAVAALFFSKNEWWWIPAIGAISLSQYLIWTSWQDAKFGTIANVVILIAAIVGYGAWSFKHQFENEVKAGLTQTASVSDSILTEADIRHLPEPVRKYLNYTGAVGKPKVINFRVEFTGQIRKDEQSEWMPFSSDQYNFMDASTRLFFMNASMKGLPVAGFHSFKNGNAFMDIRLFSLFRVQYQSGPEMGKAETVTFFNDMCCMAPATLIDKRIKWLDVDENKVKAAFTNNGIAISAWLYFNDKGELVNFISDDRYAVSEDGTMQQLRWSTPMRDYKEINGHKLASYAEAVYTYPAGDLTYGNFSLTSVEYNCR